MTAPRASLMKGRRLVGRVRAPVLAVALALALAGVALAHGDAHHELDTQLVENGRAVMVGAFTAAQPGPLVVVPSTDGPLPCGPWEDADWRIPLGDDSGVVFLQNATHLVGVVEQAPGASGYTALAVDTASASRALVLMSEAAVSNHALAAVVLRADGPPAARTGVLGIPYDLPGDAGHDMGDFAPEGGGIVLDHDDSFPGARACPWPDAGYVAFAFERTALPEALAPGSVVHVVALHDGAIAEFLPRPIDGSTAVLQANLYLARPGEDPAAMRAAFDPTPGATAWLPLALVGVGLVWAATERRA